MTARTPPQKIVNIKLFSKQITALKLLQDAVTNEVCYGGGARGGKSWLGCVWQIMRRLSMPGSAGLIGREELTKLKDTTLRTFFQVLKVFGVRDQVNFNSTSLTATFPNGSVIFFREIKYLPSDPEFDRLGSYDLTDAFLDEAQQIVSKAISVLKGRFSVLSGPGWSTIPKALYTCNPAKNWIYTDFVKPQRSNTISVYRKFVASLAKDNPHVSQDFLDNLLRADKVTVQRLYYGNFDYDDDPAVLCDYDAISDCFTNTHVQPGRESYLSEDLAMQGRDKQIGGYWQGMVCRVIHDKAKSTGVSIENDIRAAMTNYSIPRSRVIVDSDGMGGYLESYLSGIKEFHGNAACFYVMKESPHPDDAPQKVQEFNNLKSQCAYKLAELVNKRLIHIVCTDEQRELIMQELAVLKSADVDNDTGKKAIISKEAMKELLGRSPDYLDMLIMRMYFEVLPDNEVRMYGY